jgi:hypothetical protein
MDKLLSFGIFMIIIFIIIINVGYKPTCYDIYDYYKENFDNKFNEIELDDFTEIDVQNTKPENGCIFTHESMDVDILSKNNRIEFIEGKLEVIGKHSILFENSEGKSTIVEFENEIIAAIGDYITNHEELFIMYSDLDVKRYMSLYNGQSTTDDLCQSSLNETHSYVEEWMREYCPQ